jgi:hypothetical protein
MTGPRSVPPSFRLLNGLAALLFLVGAGVYVRAWLGLRGLRSYQASPGDEAFAALSRFQHFWNLSRIGVALVWGAVGVAVLAALAWALLRRREKEG